jgi:microcompartment protein CcmK/EutM
MIDKSCLTEWDLAQSTVQLSGGYVCVRHAGFKDVLLIFVEAISPVGNTAQRAVISATLQIGQGIGKHLFSI